MKILQLQFTGIGDLHIHRLDHSKDTNSYLLECYFSVTLSFWKNFILGKTCFKTVSGTSVDVMLINRCYVFNRPRSSRKTVIVETGLSDHHKLVFSFFRTYFAKFPPKKPELKNLIWKAFFMNLIKSYYKVKSIKQCKWKCIKIIMMNVQLLRVFLGVY